MTLLRPGLISALLFASLGCEPRADVAIIMSHDACQGMSEGVIEVDLDGLAAIRGMQFLPVDPQAMEEATEQPTDIEAPDYRLIAIAAAAQPSRGYALTLESSSVSEDALRLDATLQPPSVDTPVPQQLSSEAPRPCLVIATSHLDLPVIARLGTHELGSLAAADGRSGQ